ARLTAPRAEALPVVFSSPHSGRCWPRDFVEGSSLPLEALRQSEDFMVDVLFEGATAHGFWLYAAQRPRAWLDLNRDPRELDAAMFAVPPPEGSLLATERVRAGLGVIPRIVAEGMEIHPGPLAPEEARRRLEEGYFPWHAGLRALLDGLRREHGQAVLIDCHSMPASAARAMTPLGGRRPHVILGDCEGASCSRLLTDVLYELFTAQGLVVARNRVYTGGFITRHYGLCGLGFQAIQIEINRELYMEEGRCRPGPGFARLRTIIDTVLEALPERLALLWRGLPQAAE
ncbi:MAG TPA: N-formylglutamate amidohydrolase, partial [Thermopetrobacter sp.]|nr:N-formylglutamate amidohydrolase [Thermopetrobacter sp.]